MSKLDTVILDNGLKIYLYNEPKRHSTFFQFNTYCGGITKHFIYDNQEYHLNDGVAHILEHYIVECNERGNFLEELGNKQMSTNASTSPDITNYYFETVENVCYGIQTILDGIYHVFFSEDRLEKLKNPICQEIRGKQDNKFYQANRRRMKNLFPQIDYFDVGGTLEEVESTTIHDLEALYHSFYHPKNQFIVIAGNFNKEEVLKTIKDFYQSVSFDSYSTSIIPYPRVCDVNLEEDSFEFPSPMNFTEISFKVDVSSLSNTQLLDLDFYLNAFYTSSFGVTSQLYKELVDKKIIIDSIRFGITPFDHFLILSFGAYTDKVSDFQNAIMKEIKSLNHLDLEKFEMDKKNAIVQIILRDENIFKMIFPFINNIVYYDYPYLDTVQDVEKLQYQDYVDMIHQLDFTHFSKLTIHPLKK